MKRDESAKQDGTTYEYSWGYMLKRFHKEYIAPKAREFYTVQVMHVICALLALAPPIILRDIIDDAIAAGDMYRLWVMVGWAVLVFGTDAILRGVKTYWGHEIAQVIVQKMRNRLYRQYQALSMRFHDNQKTGELMARVIDDLNILQEFVHHGPEGVLNSLVMLIGTIAVMLTMSVRLTLLSLLFVPLLAAIGYFLLRKMHVSFREERRRIASVTDRLEDNLSGMKVIKVFTNEDFEEDRFGRVNQNHVTARLTAIWWMSLLFPASRILNAMGIVAVLAYGGWLTLQGEMTVGVITAFNMYLLQFRVPLLQLIRVNEQLGMFFASMERFYEHVSKNPDIITVARPKSKPQIDGEITFEDVHFQYEEDESVLQGVSFHVEPKKTIALVGPSGSGKTTIIRLVPRMYEIDRGRILVDGIDVRDWDIEQLRSSTAMVMQDDYLFSDSIASNIAYGRPGASFEEVVRAAKDANAHDFIVEMPNGYDTTVGQRGLKLSGGQRQRVSIARAFLRDPEILILDEATSAVDLETEKLIQDAIDKVTRGRTTFMIAHRLATIVNADEIMFVENGRIHERGTHQDLVNRDSKYRQFYRMQFESRGTDPFRETASNID